MYICYIYIYNKHIIHYIDIIYFEKYVMKNSVEFKMC